MYNTKFIVKYKFMRFYTYIWMPKITYYFNFLYKIRSFFLVQTGLFSILFYCNFLSQPFSSKNLSISLFYIKFTPSPTKFPISNSFWSMRKLCPIPTFFKSLSKNYSEININTIIRNSRFWFLFSLRFPQRSFNFLIIFITRTARTWLRFILIFFIFFYSTIFYWFGRLNWILWFVCPFPFLFIFQNQHVSIFYFNITRHF